MRACSSAAPASAELLAEEEEEEEEDATAWAPNNGALAAVAAAADAIAPSSLGYVYISSVDAAGAARRITGRKLEPLATDAEDADGGMASVLLDRGAEAPSLTPIAPLPLCMLGSASE